MLEVVESISESKDASYFDIKEFTGIYKAVDPDKNEEGWGAPNPEYADATSAILQIKLPDPVTLLPQKDFCKFTATGLNYLDISSVLPNVIKTPFRVNASTVNLDKFTVGLYEFLITYGGSWGVTLYKWKMRQAFIAQGCCCVTSLQAELECGSQDQIKRDDWMNGVVALAAIESDMNCLKQKKTADAMKRLNDICLRNPCKSCN